MIHCSLSFPLIIYSVGTLEAICSVAMLRLHRRGLGEYPTAVQAASSCWKLTCALWFWIALATASPTSSDSCAKIAGQTFAPPKDVLACQRSFPFNETLRQNVLKTISGVFDFYTFEDYYLNSPAPFQESTVNIRHVLSRINSTTYEVGLSLPLFPHTLDV
jgi:hypothetical protein